MKQFLHHLFLPHESNNQRAKLLHHSSLLLLIGLLVGGSFLFSFTAKHNQAVLGISYSINPQELLILTNAKRQESGLAPLTLDGSLTQAALRKAQDMFTQNYWAHIAPDGTTPWYFIRDSGYEYVYAGENLARGFTTSTEVVNAWMASPTHRENMLSANYNDVGFAILEGNLTGDDTVLVVEEFGNKTSAVAQAKSEQQAQEAPQPSPVVVQLSLTPTPTPIVVLPVSPTVIPSPSTLPQSLLQVAAFRNDPLINKPEAQKNIAFLIVLGILFLLLVDIIMVERKGLIRILSHNIDHIIFFCMILLLILLISKGGIL